MCSLLVMRSHRLVIVVGFLSVLLTQPTMAQSTFGDTLSPVPIALTLRGVGTAEFDILTRNGTAYLPIGTLFRLLDINVNYDRESGRVDGFFIEVDDQYTIEPLAGLAQRGSSSIRLTSADFVVRRDDLFLRSDIYKSLFELDLRYHPTTLRVSLNTRRKLPVFRERERALARERALQARPFVEPEVFFLRRDIFFGGGRVDWSVTSSISPGRLARHRYGFSIGNQLLGGNLQARIGGSVHRPPQWEDVTGRLQYGWPANPLVRQVTLGDMFLTGLSIDRVTGVSIGNRPITRRFFFADEDITLPPGVHEIVDFYRGAILLESRSLQPGDARVLQNRLSYGTADYSLRTYDEWGVERIYTFRVEVPEEMVRPGEVQYVVTAGKQRRGRGNWLGTSKAQWGVNSRMTLGFGVDFTDDQFRGGRFHPIIYAATRVWPNSVLDATIAPSASSRARITLSYPSGFSGELAYSYYPGNTYFNSLGSRDERSLFFVIPILSGIPSVRLDLSGQQLNQEFSRQYLFQGGVLLGFRSLAVRTSHSIRYSDQYITPKTLLLQSSGLSLTGRMPEGVLARVHSRYDHLGNRFTDVRFDVSRRITRWGYVRLSYERSFVARISTIRAEFNYQFPFSILRSTFTKSAESGSWGFTQQVHGSIGFAHEDGSFVFDNRNRVGFGGMLLKPFVDLNGNGFQDPGETEISHAKIRVGRADAIASLLHHTPGLGFVSPRTLPYEDYVVLVDPKSLEDPLLVPQYSTISVFSEPDFLKVIPLPVVFGGIVRGMVQAVSEGRTIPLEGVPLVLESEDLTGGKPRHTQKGLSFSTGEFEFIGIPPGRYAIFIEETVAAQLGYAVEQSRHTFVVNATYGGDEISGINFILK